MKKRIRKIIAFVLAFVMIFTSGSLQRYTYVFASEENTAAVKTKEETQEAEETGGKEDKAQGSDKQETAGKGQESVQDRKNEKSAGESGEDENIPNDESDQIAGDQEQTSDEIIVTGADNSDGKADDSLEKEPAKNFNKSEYVYEDKFVKVTARLSDVKAIPDDARLVVTPITGKTRGYDYETYMDALNHSAKGSHEKYNDANTLLYDVAFMATEKDASGRVKQVELQPESGLVNVNITFKREQLTKQLGAKKPSDVEVKHLPLKASTKEKYDTTKEAEKLEVKDVKVEDVLGEKANLRGKDGVSFKTRGFSVYAFSYTVDFTYDNYTYSIAGESSILLSKLFDILKIRADVADVKNVSFSDSALVKVESRKNDWLLTSLKPFSSNEKLTVEMKNGVKYVIKVTDNQENMTYTLKFYDRDGNFTSGMPEDIKSKNPHLFAYLLDEDENIVGWNCTPFDQNSCTATIPESFSNQLWQANTAVNYDGSVHQLKMRVVQGYQNAGNLIENVDWSTNTWAGINWKGTDQFDGYKFKTDDPEPNVFKMQKDWNKKLEVDLSYFGSDTGDNAPATIIIRGQGTTTGWHYYKLSVNKIGWKEGEGKYPIGEWFKKDGSSFQTNDYSDTWQDVEAVLFSGDVTISEAANQLENGRNGIPMLAGYILKSKEREIRDGSIDHEAGIQTITLPVVLDSTPLDAALTPEEVLGDAHEFGIVADTYNQDGHTETNFAVHHLRFTPSGQNLDIDGSGEGPIPFYAGDVVNNFRFGQNQNVDAFLYMTQSDIDARSIAQDKDTYQVTVIPTPKDEIDGYVESMLAEVRKTSKNMLEKTTVKPKAVQNGKVNIDTSGYPENTTIYVDCSNIMNKIASNGDLIINKLNSQTIVFNIPSSGTVKIGEFIVFTENETGGVASTTSAMNGDPALNQKVDDVILNHIFFNAANASKVETNNASALFLAPEAGSFEQSNGAGWIVCGGTVDSRTEWHFYRHTRHFDDKVGQIQINKILGDGYPADAKTKEYSFYVRKMVDGNYVYFYNNTTTTEEGSTVSTNSSSEVMPIMITGSGKLILTKLEPGEYEVVEIRESAEIANYTLTVGGECSAKVVGGRTTIVNIINTYNDQGTSDEKGNLKLTKTIKGVVTKEEAEGALKFQVTTTRKEGDTDVTYYLDKDGKLTKTETTLEIKDGFTTTDNGKTYTKTFENVEAGTYNVTETNSTIPGYRFESESSVTSGKATVSRDKTEKVELKDEYTEIGSFTIEKKVGGGVTEEEAEGALKFQVTTTRKEGDTDVTYYLDKDGKLTKTETTLEIKDGFTTTDNGKTYTKTFENVEAGTYNVTETNSTIPGYRFESESSVISKDVTVSKDKTEKVELKDEYSKDTLSPTSGPFEIRKTIGGGVTKSEVDNGSITFEVTTGTGADKRWLDKDGNQQENETLITLGEADGFTASENGTVWTKTFASVPAGTYEVKEKNTELNGYKFVQEGSKTNNSVTVTAGATAAAVAELTDEYTEIGSFTIEKKVGGGVTEEEAEGALKFQVTTTRKEGDTDVTYYLDKDGKLTKTETSLEIKDGFTTTDNGKTYTKTFENVEAGTYNVTETNSTIPGYRFESESSVTSGKAKVSKDKTEKVELKDEYTKDSNVENTGNLIITKSFDGLNVTDSEKAGALTFEVKTPDGKWLTSDGRVTDKLTLITLASFTKGSDGKYTKTFTDVPVGEYTVTETNTDVAGYAFNSSLSTTTGKETVENAKTANIELKDVYDKTFSIKIRNVDKKDGQVLAGARLKLFKYNETSKTWEEVAGQEWTSDEKDHEISGLVAGKYRLRTTSAPNNYTPVVEETEFTINAQGKTVDTEGKEIKDDLLVVQDTKNSGTPTTEDGKEDNTEVGSFSIEKKVGGGVTKEEAEGALKFQVTTTRKEGDAEVTYYLDKDGKLTKTETSLGIKDGFTTTDGGKTYTKTFKNVETGTYHVVETNSTIPGYRFESASSVISKDVTVSKDKTEKVELKDEYTKDSNVENTGNLIITKSLDGLNVTDSEKAGALTFEVKTPDGKWLTSDGRVSDKLVIMTLASFTKGSDGKYTKTFTGIPVGEYTVTETNTDVAGYALNSSLSTTSGKATVENAKTINIELKDVYDKTFSIKIRNVDKEDGQVLAGARLKLFKYNEATKNWEDVEGQEWTSEETDHEISGLVAGKYRLRTTSAPDGYVPVVKETDFTINEQGKMIDEDGKEITDGVLVVQDAQSSESSTTEDDDDGDSTTTTAKKRTTRTSSSGSSGSSGSTTRNTVARTGDTNPVGLWTGIAAASLMLALAMIWFLRKKETDK